MTQPRAIFRDYQTQESLRSDRSAGDRARHRQKVREAIRGNIADIVSEQPIIGRAGDTIVKIPVRGIKEYRFIYGKAEGGGGGKGAGAGDGNTQQGQVIQKGDQKGKGQAGQAGDDEGVDYYETEIMLDELVDIMFEDLELPDMERRRMRETLSERNMKPAGTQRAGTPAKLHRKRTMKTLIKRRIAAGSIDTDEPSPIRRDDLRYKRRKPKPRRESNAVVICIMDTSGSMDTMKKYLARCFFFLLFQFVRTRYTAVEVVFIAHHTTAKEVTEHEFFHKGESGGTMISSGYQKALDVIHERYHPDVWNVYAFHGSDGDNFPNDMDATFKAARELCDLCNLFGYGEIKSWGEGLIGEFNDHLHADNFKAVRLNEKEDVWPAFQALLTKDRGRQQEVGAEADDD